jgi:hypothetical protein
MSWMFGLIHDGIGHEFMKHEFMISLLDNRGAVVIAIISHASTKQRVDEESEWRKRLFWHDEY